MSNNVDAALRRLFGPGVNSDTRAEHMIQEMKELPPEEVFAVFAETWSRCDDTWHLRNKLLLCLSEVRPFVALPKRILPEDREWFAGLPEELTIYRGCSRERVRGLSWTLDRSVAERFARGHRWIRVPDPIIASGRIRKATILFATNSRNEAEVIIDPSEVCDLSM